MGKMSWNDLTDKEREIIDNLRIRKRIWDVVPKEYTDNINIIKAERKFKLRKIIRKGYDIIKNQFFNDFYILYIASYI